MPTSPSIRPVTPADRDWIVARHGALYAEAEGFDQSFPVLVGQIADAFLTGHDPACEAGWIAEGVDARLGCIFCVAETPGARDVAKLRLFMVEPAARGSGVAQALLDTCMGFARGAGYARMRLWTHESHRAAGRIYARNRFALTDSRPAHSFGVDVVEQTWERAL